MLHDDHSDNKWYFALSDTSAENAERAIIDWYTAFVVPKLLISNGPTNFKNETVRLVSKSLKVLHHFCLPYHTWSNGAVERLGKELIGVLRLACSEFQLRSEEWPDVLPLIQSVLIVSYSPQRGIISPLTAFMDIKPTPTISTFIQYATPTKVSLADVQSERPLNISTLQSKMAELHPVVQDSAQSGREKRRYADFRGILPKYIEGTLSSWPVTSLLLERTFRYVGEVLFGSSRL